MEVQAANEAAKAGKLGSTIQSILSDLKPEAAYFVEEQGKRTCYMILDMKEVSELPAVAEPWFLAFKATVEARPAMTPADLAKAAPAIEAAVKKYT